MFRGSATLTFGLIGAGATATQTITVTGAAAGDHVVLGLPTITAGLTYNAYATGNTVNIRCTNTTAAGITPAVATYSALVLSF